MFEKALLAAIRRDNRALVDPTAVHRAPVAAIRASDDRAAADRGSHPVVTDNTGGDRIRPNNVGGAAAQVVRRKMAFGSSDLAGDESSSTRLRRMLGENSTWNQIRETLKRYEKAPDPRTELRTLRAVEMLAKEWLDKYGASKDSEDVKKAASLRRLVSMCDTEISALGAEQDADYSERVGSTRAALAGTRPAAGAKGSPAPARPFSFATESGVRGLDPAHLAKSKAAADVSTAGLTDAEISAISMYTGGDYRTMNPTLQGSDSWLAHQMGELSNRVETKFASNTVQSRMEKAGGTPSKHDRRVIKMEAMQHSRVAVSGLKKLPPVVTDAYRGMKLPQADIDRDYAPGSIITYKAFSSTSTRRDISRGYASVPAEGKVGVLLVFKVTDGRNVKSMSLAAGEDEVLLLPGAQFKVTGKPTMDGQIRVVELVQIGGGNDPAPGAAPVALGAAPVDQAVQPAPVAPTRAASAPLAVAPVPGAVAAQPVGAQPAAPQQSAARPARPSKQPTPSVPVPAGVSAQAMGPVDPDAQLRAEARRSAQALIASSQQAEPAVTACLSKLAGANKAKMEGLAHRLKTESSLTRKLTDRARTRVTGGDYAGAVAKEAARMNDVLRYTMVIPDDRYKAVETSLRDEMRRLGYDTTGYWNAWDTMQSKLYHGVNITFTAKDTGQQFELQVHTKKSFATKQANHDMYEEFRDPKTSPARKRELEALMEKSWTKVPVPKGVVPKGAKK